MRPASILRVFLFAAAVVAVALVWPGGSLVAVTGAVLSVGLVVAPRATLVAFVVLLAIQPAVVNALSVFEPALASAARRLDETVVAAALFRVLILLTERPWPARMGETLGLSGVYAGAGLISGAIAGVPPPVLALGAFLALKFPALLLLALSIRWRPRDPDVLVRAIPWMAVLILVSGVLLFAVPEAVQRVVLGPGGDAEALFTRGGLQSMRGIFIHPGTFGWAMALLGCYGMGQVLVGRRLSGGITLGAAVSGVLGSLRRKPLVGFPVAVAVGLLTLVPARRRLVWVLALGALAGGVFLVARDRIRLVVADTLEGYLDPGAPTPARVLLYVTGLEIARERFPLGAGFGRFGGYASELHYSPLYVEYGLSQVWGLEPDNAAYMQDAYWPHVVAESGVIGALALAAFLLRLFVLAGRIGGRARDPALRVLGFGAATALVEAVFESVASPLFELTFSALALALPLGIVLSLEETTRTLPQRGPEPHPATPSPAASSSR